MPPYGIINTNQALPFRSMVDMYDMANQDLVDQINTSPKRIAPPMTIDQIMAGSVLGPNTTGGISTIENNIVPTNMFNQPFNDYYGPNNIDTSFGVANEPDEEENVEGATKKGGLADLFKTILGFAVPGASLLMGGGQKVLGGIQNLNQRLRNTTFGRSATLADYFQARRDEKAREAARQRGIDKEMARSGTGRDIRGSDFGGDFGQRAGGGGFSGTGPSSDITGTQGSF